MPQDPARRRLEASDLWTLKRVGGPAPTLDGTWAVVPVTTYDIAANKGRTRLWAVADETSPRALTAEEYSSEQPALSPDGRRLAFVRKKEAEKAQLYLMPLEGGEPEKLTNLPLGVLDPRWFPDGRRIAFVSNVVMARVVSSSSPLPTTKDAASASSSVTNREEEPETVANTRTILAARESEPCKVRVTESRVYRYWDKWLTGDEVPHIFVLDTESRLLSDVTPESTGWFDFMDPTGQYDIAPDGGEIAFSANGSRAPHDRLNWDVFVVPLSREADGRTRGRELRSITSGNPADDLKPRYSPDGQAIWYGMQQNPFFYADKVRLVRYDRETRQHDVMTESWDRSASAWEPSPDGRALYVVAEDEARTAVFEIKPSETGIGDPRVRRLVKGGTVSSLKVAGNGRLWFTYQDLSHPPEVHTCGADGADFKRVTRFNDEILVSIEMGSVREAWLTGAGGRKIQMLVVYPPGFDPAQKWPLVQLIHGGPHGISGDQFHWRWNAQLLASPGYIVAMVNFHGSTSFGQEFAESILGAHAEKPFADVMAATDHLAAEGSVDERRMAAVGGSYGGYLVTWIAGHTDRFACLVNHAGVYDLMAQYSSDVTQGRHLAYGGEPWAGMDNIDRSSPHRFAHGFTSPMLIIHGDNDYRVPYTQGLEVYGVYKAKGVPARLVSYPDENHWILSPRNSIHWYAEVHAWLEKHLSDETTKEEVQ